MPHWIKKAGYKAECTFLVNFISILSDLELTEILVVGKFLNGYSQANYHIPPKGWDHVDALVCLTSRDPGLFFTNTFLARTLYQRLQQRGNVSEWRSSSTIQRLPQHRCHQNQGVSHSRHWKPKENKTNCMIGTLALNIYWTRKIPSTWPSCRTHHMSLICGILLRLKLDMRRCFPTYKPRDKHAGTLPMPYRLARVFSSRA